MKIIAQLNHVIFQFCEDIVAGRFVNKTGSDIIVSSISTDQSNMPRWARATHVGPDCLDVQVGDYILIEPGKWTNGFYVGEARYWKTDEEQIIAVSDAPESTY